MHGLRLLGARAYSVRPHPPVASKVKVYNRLFFQEFLVPPLSLQQLCMGLCVRDKRNSMVLVLFHCCFISFPLFAVGISLPFCIVTLLCLPSAWTLTEHHLAKFVWSRNCNWHSHFRVLGQCGRSKKLAGDKRDPEEKMRGPARFFWPSPLTESLEQATIDSGRLKIDWKRILRRQKWSVTTLSIGIYRSPSLGWFTTVTQNISEVSFKRVVNMTNVLSSLGRLTVLVVLVRSAGRAADWYVGGPWLEHQTAPNLSVLK